MEVTLWELRKGDSDYGYEGEKRVFGNSVGALWVGGGAYLLGEERVFGGEEGRKRELCMFDAVQWMLGG